jgi:Zn finger protein HypA/HybF involved in hydrogenase expression
MEVLILIIIWLLSIFFSVKILAPYNQSGWGFLFSLFFGPIGTIMSYALSLTYKEKVEVKCKFCAEKIKKEAVVCKHCGSKLT